MNTILNNLPQFYNDIDAVKYFTTGTMSGNTLKPNMRKLGWLKKKGNKQKTCLEATNKIFPASE